MRKYAPLKSGGRSRRKRRRRRRRKRGRRRRSCSRRRMRRRRRRRRRPVELCPAEQSDPGVSCGRPANLTPADIPEGGGKGG